MTHKPKLTKDQSIGGYRLVTSEGKSFQIWSDKSLRMWAAIEVDDSIGDVIYEPSRKALTEWLS